MKKQFNKVVEERVSELIQERMNEINDKLYNLEEVIKDVTTKIAEEHNVENPNDWDD